MLTAVTVMYCIIVLLVVYFWFVGLWRAFLAHPILGVICFMIQAPLAIFGAIYVLFNYDIAEEIVKLFD
ncbi:hypothetical protein KBI23_05855 [bacterium]|jgi:hypothetical protein|nr:hypothetical protein [bacterium]MBP9810466.1 hypothetical protein [bacterium]